MDRLARKARATALVNDEMFEIAFNEVGESIIKQLLASKTQEQREEKFQEYQGLKRVFEKLKVWSAETVKED